MEILEQEKIEKKLAYAKAYRDKNKEKASKYYRAWYLKNGRHRAVDYLEKVLEYQEANPEKIIIHKRTELARRRGEITRPDVCSKCGVHCLDIHAHHLNYDHYLNFIWICPSCHKRIHSHVGY